PHHSNSVVCCLAHSPLLFERPEKLPYSCGTRYSLRSTDRKTDIIGESRPALAGSCVCSSSAAISRESIGRSLTWLLSPLLNVNDNCAMAPARVSFLASSSDTSSVTVFGG